MWRNFKLKIEAAFCDVDRELKFYSCLSGLCWTTSVAAYTKDLPCIALELGD